MDNTKSYVESLVYLVETAQEYYKDNEFIGPAISSSFSGIPETLLADIRPTRIPHYESKGMRWGQNLNRLAEILADSSNPPEGPELATLGYFVYVWSDWVNYQDETERIPEPEWYRIVQTYLVRSAAHLYTRLPDNLVLMFMAEGMTLSEAKALAQSIEKTTN